ncbi:MAG: M48 family metalloprotease [Saprospiraceae bacterium]|nr:M48 family metalloprotease [Saprospiraceae bacterium]
MAYYRRQSNYGGSPQPSRRSSNIRITLLIGLAIAAYSFWKYYSQSEFNAFTGENQHTAGLTVDQEIALGLQSTPQMIQQYGGLHPDQRAQQYLDMVGNRLVQGTGARETGYKFDFHLLADPETVNAFALPGGQVFITAALFSRLETEDQLAGVIGHEIGHVLARHGAERIAKEQLTQGLTGAAVVASGDYNTAQAAQMIGQLINMKYGREQELQADDLGVRLMMETGYNPEDMVGVMEILKAVSGPNRVPEFQSTHPDPENRIEHIRESIKKYRQQLSGSQTN